MPATSHTTTTNATETVVAVDTLRKALLRAESHASHWEKETRKMDKLARDAHDKLDAKKQVRKALKAELASAKEEAGKWQARYMELAEARIVTATKPVLSTATDEGGAWQARYIQLADARIATNTKANDASPTEERLARARKEQELNEKLAAAQASTTALRVKLQQAENELNAQKLEIPIVQERLKVGGAAFRKLQALEPKAKADELLAQRLTEETNQLKEKLQTASQEITILRPAAARAKQLEIEAINSTRSRQAELEATKEKLRAATNEVSATAGKVQACTDMLTRAEQVLKTCSQLHAAKGESHALVRALTETTSNIAQFLQAVASSSK